MSKTNANHDTRGVFNSVSEFYASKLIHQFRKGKLKHDINVFLLDTLKKFEKNIKKKFEYKTDLKTRIKFLFTGKLN